MIKSCVSTVALYSDIMLSSILSIFHSFQTLFRFQFLKVSSLISDTLLRSLQPLLKRMFIGMRSRHWKTADMRAGRELNLPCDLARVPSFWYPSFVHYLSQSFKVIQPGFITSYQFIDMLWIAKNAIEYAKLFLFYLGVKIWVMNHAQTCIQWCLLRSILDAIPDELLRVLAIFSNKIRAFSKIMAVKPALRRTFPPPTYRKTIVSEAADDRLANCRSERTSVAGCPTTTRTLVQGRNSAAQRIRYFVSF